MRCQNAFTFNRFAPLLIVVRIKEPSNGPCTDRRPRKTCATDYRRGYRFVPSPAWVALPRMREGEQMTKTQSREDIGDVNHPGRVDA